MSDVIGAVAVVVAILLFPVALLMSAAAVAALIGWVSTSTSEQDHDGSELLQLNS
jgi:hypothetical protein